MDLIDLINTARREAGLLPLQVSPCLTMSASKHAAYMDSWGCTHYEYIVVSPFRRMKRAGYRPFVAGGECVGTATDPADLIQAWLNDATHRSILLGPYTHVGFGNINRAWAADFATGMEVVQPPNHLDWSPF